MAAQHERSGVGRSDHSSYSSRRWDSATWRQWPRLHVLYWEAGQQESVCLDGTVTGGGPTLCKNCKGVVKAWRFRLDNLQACVRSCGKEGSIFRGEVVDFVCLSPRLVLRYKLADFGAWLTRNKSKALTEEMVIGTPIQVCSGHLAAEDCGVTTTPFGNSHAPSWGDWLADYTRRLRGTAEDSNGRLVVLLLDRDGAELLALDVGPEAEVEHTVEKPIVDVLIVLGGPAGVTKEDSHQMEHIFSTEANDLVKIKLPGGLQHSNVALTDLLMAHERRWLLPAVEKLIRFGSRRYAEWRTAAQNVLRLLQAPELGAEAALAHAKSVEEIASRSRKASARRSTGYTAWATAKPPQERVEELEVEVMALKLEVSELKKSRGTLDVALEDEDLAKRLHQHQQLLMGVEVHGDMTNGGARQASSGIRQPVDQIGEPAPQRSCEASASTALADAIAPVAPITDKPQDSDASEPCDTHVDASDTPVVDRAQDPGWEKSTDVEWLEFLAQETVLPADIPVIRTPSPTMEQLDYTANDDRDAICNHAWSSEVDKHSEDEDNEQTLNEAPDPVKEPATCCDCDNPVGEDDTMYGMYCNACFRMIWDELNLHNPTEEGSPEGCDREPIDAEHETLEMQRLESVQESVDDEREEVDAHIVSTSVDAKPVVNSGAKVKEVRIRYADVEKILDVRNVKELTLTQMRDVATSIVKKLHLDPSLRFIRMLDLQQLSLTDECIATLVEALKVGEPKLTTLMLHKNRLTDVGACSIADLIEGLPSPIEQIHLSHNYIEGKGARALLAAAGRHLAYPRRLDGVAIPLFLRLEQNPGLKGFAGEAEAEVSSARQAVGEPLAGPTFMVCFGKKGQCKADYCLYAKPGEPGPIVHLPYMNLEPGAGHRRPGKTVRATEGGWKEGQNGPNHRRNDASGAEGDALRASGNSKRARAAEKSGAPNHGRGVQSAGPSLVKAGAKSGAAPAQASAERGAAPAQVVDLAMCRRIDEEEWPSLGGEKPKGAARGRRPGGAK